MRLLRHDLRLVGGDYHLQRVVSDDKGLRPHQSLVDSAESLATNFNDARLSSRPAELSSPKPKTTQTATIRQETTQTATIRQETTRRTATTQESHSKPEFDFAVPGQTKQRSDDSPHRHSAYSSRQNLNDARLSSPEFKRY